MYVQVGMTYVCTSIAMHVAAQMYSMQNHVNQVSKCVHVLIFFTGKTPAANISTGMPFNNVIPAKRIIEAVHLAITII